MEEEKQEGEGLIPITNLKKEPSIQRKVEVSDTDISHSCKQIEIKCVVHYFTSTGESFSEYIAPRQFPLFATNEVWVDSKGDYAQDEEGKYLANPTEKQIANMGLVGEFDYWINYIQTQNFKFYELAKLIVERADKSNRFD